MVLLDGFAVFLTVVICSSVVVASLLADGYLRREGLDGPELYILLLLSASGGVIMAAAALVDRNDSPTDAQIDAAVTNLCRCGIYPRLRESIRRATRIKTGRETVEGAPAPGIDLRDAVREVPSLVIRGLAAPATDGRRIYAGFDNGKVAALSSDDGSMIWEATIAAPTGASELANIVDVDGDLVHFAQEVYATSYNGHAAALAAESGEIVWRRELSSVEAPAIAQGNTFVTDVDSVVHAFDRLSGVLLDRFARDRVEEPLRARQVVCRRADVRRTGIGEGHQPQPEEGDDEHNGRGHEHRWPLHCSSLLSWSLWNHPNLRSKPPEWVRSRNERASAEECRDDAHLPASHG